MRSRSINVYSRLFLLVGICILSIAIRLFPVVKWGSVIHEFDPHFNLRVTKFLTEHSLYDFLNWFDDRAWYPLGRSIGSTVYPGLMAASAGLYHLLHAFNFRVNIRDVCVFFSPLASVIACIMQYLLTLQVTSNTLCALLSATFLAISPAYISRSTAGSYDNEGIAIPLLIATLFLWLKAVTYGSMRWSAMASLAYFGMVLSWGGHVFLINIIPMHTLLVSICERTIPCRVYIAYCTFYILSTLLAMQVPFVGFNAVLSGEHMASHGTFILLQFCSITQYVYRLLSVEYKYKFLRIVSISLGVIVVCGLIAFRKNILHWSGRSLSLLNPSYASKYIPIIASVGEHQPTSWATFYLSLGPAMLFMPLGVVACFQLWSERKDGATLMIIYSIFGLYFSGVMVRLMLTLAPIACFLSAAGISRTLTILCRWERDRAPGPEARVNLVTATESLSWLEVVQILWGQVLLPYANCNIKPLKEQNPSSRNINNSVMKVPAGTGLFLIGVTLLLYNHIHHCSRVSLKAYSSTSLVYEEYKRSTDDNKHAVKLTIHDDLREAMSWLRFNSPEDSNILSWWDYGYQLSSLANRTVLVDNNTWNTTHIATAGRILLSSENEAWNLAASLNVDYIIVMFGGKLGPAVPGDDLDKFPWILKISENVFPNEVLESDFKCPNENTLPTTYCKWNENATIAIKESLLYKLSYLNFDKVESIVHSKHVYPNSVDDATSVVAGWDHRRQGSIGNTSVTLKMFQEVFTSNEWIFRIYAVAPRPHV